MVYKVNAYFAALIIVIIGGGAALLIMHISNSNTGPLYQKESTKALERDILK